MGEVHIQSQCKGRATTVSGSNYDSNSPLLACFIAVTVLTLLILLIYLYSNINNCTASPQDQCTISSTLLHGAFLHEMQQK